MPLCFPGQTHLLSTYLSDFLLVTVWDAWPCLPSLCSWQHVCGVNECFNRSLEACDSMMKGGAEGRR